MRSDLFMLWREGQLSGEKMRGEEKEGGRKGGERQKEGEADGGKMEKEVEKSQNFHINL